MKIAIGCDEAANTMKDAILAELKSQGHEVIDYGTHNGAPVLYPDIGVAVAEAIARGDAERGRAPGDRARYAAARPPANSIWPMVFALGAVVLTVGLVTYQAVFTAQDRCLADA